MLPFSGAKAVTTENFPDGGKSLTYRYDELDELIAKYQQALEKLNPIEKKRNKLKSDICYYTSWPLLIGGCLSIGSGVDSLKDKKNNKVSAKAVAKCALGTLGLILGAGGLVAYANGTFSSHQCFEMEMQLFALRSTKSLLDRYIDQNICTPEQAREDFFYRFFIDKNGMVEIISVEPSKQHKFPE